MQARVKYAGTAQLAATLLEEGDNSPADVFYAQDPGGLGAVQAMLRPLPARILDLVPAWARAPDGNWVGVSGRARTVVYNTERLAAADLPDDLSRVCRSEMEGSDRMGADQRLVSDHGHGHAPSLG